MTKEDIGIVEKLKACPFCEGDPERDSGRGSWDALDTRPRPPCHWIRCLDCGLTTRDCRTAEEAAEAWNARDPIIMEMVEALEECRGKFAEYVKLHSAKLLPERTPDEFYQNARTAHNAEVREKIERNQEMVDLCDTMLAKVSGK